MFKKLILSTVSILILASGLLFPNLALASNHNDGIALRDIGKSECVYKGGEFKKVIRDQDGTPLDKDGNTTTEAGAYKVDIGPSDIPEDLGQVLTIECVPIMISNGIYWLLVFSGAITLFMVIFGGFKFMTSGGDSKAVEGAKKTITWAIIGLVLVIMSFAIITFIATITGLDCLTRFGLLGTCGPI